MTRGVRSEREEAFLGTGWRFPVRSRERTAVELVGGEQDIEESIRIILGTSKGERVMRPEFGCGIHDYVFAAVDTTTITLMESSIEEALVEWEPRIEVIDVAADRTGLDGGVLPFRIVYRVRRTNTERNLVYPFYLGGERHGS